MSTKWPEHIAVLIPAYKAADLLTKLIPEILTYVPSHQILIVDDASEDDTITICRSFSITTIQHPINKGKGAALQSGFDYLIINMPKIKWIITMDADNQHSPDDLPLFAREAEKHPTIGIGIGHRSMNIKYMPLERILSNRLTSLILGLFCGIPVKDSQCGYRIYNTRLLKCVQCIYNRFEMESEIIMKAAFMRFPITFIPIQTLYLNGPSHISHLCDTVRWISTVIKIRMQRHHIIRNSGIQ